MFFLLFNEHGLSVARSLIDNSPKFPWVEVKHRRSYADVVALGSRHLTSANAVPINGKRSSMASSNIRRSVFKRIQFPKSATAVARKFVFDRIQFPRVSVFDRLNMPRNSSGAHSSVKANSFAPTDLPSPELEQVENSVDLNLNLSLNHGSVAASAANQQAELSRQRCGAASRHLTRGDSVIPPLSVTSVWAGATWQCIVMISGSASAKILRAGKWIRSPSLRALELITLNGLTLGL